ncbi:nuclear condensing complex subunit [Lipomyces tetrasporus]|uniref:Nuclear condensing complex subunit n=1 Tax=Lipomyces tetrasporus TaxID=54092 RepID=A0AAD7VT33_9ASCO|nr:nuclear condensing complex subunit [Lipomyces tetrasporus]KAJ8100601.1 nuclear condensing complex subunit [Lipomyces tetrasporus]
MASKLSHQRTPISEVTVLRARDSNITGKDTSSAIAAATASIFQDAQLSLTSHRKLCIKLWTVQQQAADRGYEDEFNRKFASLLNRVMPIKKSEPAAEKIVKFCSQFVEYINLQAGKVHNNDSDVEMMDIDDEEDTESTVCSRFVEYLLQHLLRGVDARSKVVRYRVCQLLASVVQTVGEIDDDLFQDLRSAFVRRVHDKESSVRVQAVMGLCRLQGTDDEDEPEPVSELLLNTLQHDSKAEVRRPVLLNLDKSNITIPYVLERARDVDTSTRRCVYTRILPAIGDFRLLSIGMREKILSWGLNDHDASVRNAAIKAFATGWLENTGNDVLELLERLDVLNSKVAAQAMKELFGYRPDLVKNLTFPDTLWDNLTAETVFLASSFADYCRESGMENLLEDKMPEVTKLGFYIEQYSEFLNVEDTEVNTVEHEFILEQLISIASNMDFSDEIGRRKIFSVIRNILAKETLSEVITDSAVTVLRKVSIRERDFCQIISETISDLHDQIGSDDDNPNGGDDSFHSALSAVESPASVASKSTSRGSDTGSRRSLSLNDERAVREILINLKCLHIAQCMLENLEGALKNNLILMSMLEDLIIPSIRSHEAPVRERGLRCLGLCCLLDKNLSLENIVLFMHCFNKGHDAVQVEALQIICDILISHGRAILDIENGIDSEIIRKMFLKGLRCESFDVQVAAAQSLSKMLMAEVIMDDEEVTQAVGGFVSENKARLKWD